CCSRPRLSGASVASRERRDDRVRWCPHKIRLDSGLVLSEISVMTEVSDSTISLPPAVQEFVLRWGDLGGQWGVNRSVAQIQALLYLSDRPMTAEEIADSLGLARSNVSNSI